MLAGIAAAIEDGPDRCHIKGWESELAHRLQPTVPFQLVVADDLRDVGIGRFVLRAKPVVFLAPIDVVDSIRLFGIESRLREHYVAVVAPNRIKN